MGRRAQQGRLTWTVVKIPGVNDDRRIADGLSGSNVPVCELKQRNVFRAAAAYIAVSWLLIQVAETLFPVFGFTEAAIRTTGLDLAERMFQLDLVCQILGMAGVAEAAGDCLRTGLEEPSYVMPFLEPLWPFYDPICDEPVFVELVAKLEKSTRGK